MRPPHDLWFDICSDETVYHGVMWGRADRWRTASRLPSANNIVCQVKDAFTPAVAYLLCFLISLRKAAESEEIQDTQQFCRIIVMLIIGGTDAMLIIWSPYALMHTKDSRSTPRFRSVNRQGEISFILQLLRYCSAFFVFLLGSFFYFFITAEILIHQKEDSFKRMFYSNLKWGKRRKRMQYCRPACVIPVFYDKYVMKIPTGVIDAAI